MHGTGHEHGLILRPPSNRLARENWEKLTAASVLGVSSWSILKHYNNGGFGGGKGGHGGRGNGGGGGGNGGAGSPSDGLQVRLWQHACNISSLE